MSQVQVSIPIQESLGSRLAPQSRVDTKQLTHPGFIFSGALIAVAIALGHWFLPEEYVLESLGILGGVLGGAYVGMGVLSPEPKKEALQIGTGALVTGLSFAGLWVSPVFFALACFTHGVWDVITGHPKCLNFPLSHWYVPMCLGYDFLFGVFILVWWSL